MNKDFNNVPAIKNGEIFDTRQKNKIKIIKKLYLFFSYLFIKICVDFSNVKYQQKNRFFSNFMFCQLSGKLEVNKACWSYKLT